jgi:putative hydrolase of the HAD superfamily
MYGRGEITKQKLNEIRYSYPLEVVGVYDKELAALFCKEALSRIPTKNKLIPGAKELLDYLYPKYNLYILSNGFQELQEHKMRTSNILHYFKELILSDHIGINKPRPEIFEYALQKTGSTIDNSIMIGDMFETDIIGAHNIGLQQIYYNSKGISPTKNEECKNEINPATTIPTYEVKSLKEIIGIL